MLPSPAVSTMAYEAILNALWTRTRPMSADLIKSVGKPHTTATEVVKAQPGASHLARMIFRPTSIGPCAAIRHLFWPMYLLSLGPLNTFLGDWEGIITVLWTICHDCTSVFFGTNHSDMS